MSKLRVGFLVDDNNINFYVADLIEFVDKNKIFENPVIITGYKKKSIGYFKSKLTLLKQNPIKVFDKVLRVIFLKLVRFIELPIAQKIFPNYQKKSRLLHVKSFPRIEILGTWSKSGFSLSFDKNEIKKISKLNLDCIVRCGSGILRGEILNLPKFGVLSFHHADNRIIRGGPSGFWEVLNNIPSSGFIIQRLNEELDGGEVLLRGNLLTRELWLINNAQLLEKSNYFFKKLLNNLALKQKLSTDEIVTLHGNKLSTLRTSKPLARYLLKVLFPKIFNVLLDKILSFKVPRWSIAFAEHNNFTKSLWRYIEIKNPKGRFLADPFVFNKNGIDYIFVEDYFFSDKKGRISAIKICDGKYEFLGVVLEEEFHLSFPFTFEHEGDVFMIPETHKSRDIRLYKCIEFPHKWELECILMENINAADSMVIKKKDEWFLLTNICSANCNDHLSELHIFYSRNLKSKEWKPIKKGNPVIFDSEKARNGGIFRHNEFIYRINQKHVKEHYGYAFAINKITNISKIDYSEELVCEIAPTFKDNIVSTHHFNANKNIAAVDFCRDQRLYNAKKT